VLIGFLRARGGAKEAPQGARAESGGGTLPVFVAGALAAPGLGGEGPGPRGGRRAGWAHGPGSGYRSPVPRPAGPGSWPAGPGGVSERPGDAEEASLEPCFPVEALAVSPGVPRTQTPGVRLLLSNGSALVPEPLGLPPAIQQAGEDPRDLYPRYSNL
jgi:hypothetical protein